MENSQIVKYRAFSLNNFEKIPQVEKYLSESEKREIRVVGSVLPFKVNNYVCDELIDWSNIPNDPIFQLTFPQKGMLSTDHFNKMAEVLDRGGDRNEVKRVATEIRLELNPHPAGQMEHNVPMLGETKLTGIQHKYDQTLLFFPSNGQTCHAYCTFCFRWPQFVGMDELKFAMRETDLLIEYLKEHPEVTDVLYTGGDPMVMSAKQLRAYIQPLIDADLPNLKTIRIGTKSIGYWPYKYVNDRDTDETLQLFKDVVDSGIHLAIMAHYNHPVELETEVSKKAVANIRKTGAQIRSQSPIMRLINDDASTWARMWQEQVDQGIIPYYMFVARDTGAQDYFAVTLADAWNIYRNAYQEVSGIGRTVRGPSMSSDPGKVHVVGKATIEDKDVFVLNFIQGRDKDWVDRPFFAEYDENAVWLDDLEPAFSDSFFFEEALQEMN
jgi:KamA family protein